MTGTLKFYDAEFPPHPPPAGMDGVCYYLPGGDASRGWTRADLASQPARYRLPIFVRSDPGQASAVGDAHTALAQLRAFGQPEGTLVAWDSETAADPAYMRVVYSVISGAGYRLIDYGSQSTVFGNDVPDGYYWGADWTGSPHLHAGDKMTQWVNFSGYDEDLAEAVLPFWDTKRPAPKPKPKEADVPYISGQITGKKTDIVFPDTITRVRFGCSMPAKINVDLRDGKGETEIDLSDKATDSVDVPKGVDMIVAHVTEPATDGTQVGYAGW